MPPVFTRIIFLYKRRADKDRARIPLQPLCTRALILYRALPYSLWRGKLKSDMKERKQHTEPTAATMIWTVCRFIRVNPHDAAMRAAGVSVCLTIPVQFYPSIIRKQHEYPAENAASPDRKYTGGVMKGFAASGHRTAYPRAIPGHGLPPEKPKMETA